MRILVLGARGMMGHMACLVLSQRHEVFGTIRKDLPPAAPLSRFLGNEQWVAGVEVTDLASVTDAIDSVRPDAVINCIGIVKQAPEATDPVASIDLNSLFPHRLAAACQRIGTRLVHLSTDCVFSGDKGMYTEADPPDPADLYGRSKLLGETGVDEGLTLRTSVVGREIRGFTSLFEWVLANRGRQVRGYARAIYSGLTTRALADVIGRVLEQHEHLSGVWHVASEPTSKFDLLNELNDRLGLGLMIERDESFVCDRSLDGSAFVSETGIEVPSWDEMLTRFAQDQALYAGIGGDVS